MFPFPGLWLRTLRAVRRSGLPVRPNPIPWPALRLVQAVDQDAVEVRMSLWASGTVQVTVWVARGEAAPHYDPDTSPVLRALDAARLHPTWMYRSESICWTTRGERVRVLAWVYTCTRMLPHFCL